MSFPSSVLKHVFNNKITILGVSSYHEPDSDKNNWMLLLFEGRKWMKKEAKIETKNRIQGSTFCHPHLLYPASHMYRYIYCWQHTWYIDKEYQKEVAMNLRVTSDKCLFVSFTFDYPFGGGNKSLSDLLCLHPESRKNCSITNSERGSCQWQWQSLPLAITSTYTQTQMKEKRESICNPISSAITNIYKCSSSSHTISTSITARVGVNMECLF